MSDLRIDINTINELTRELAGFIQRANEREFGDDSMVYAILQRYVLGFLRDKPMARAGVPQRAINVHQRPLLIAGVGFLIIEPEYRGRGFATAIIEEAAAFIRNKLGLPFGLLTCKPRLETLFSGMGRKTVDDPHIFVQPTGNRNRRDLIMVKECGGISWLGGILDLCGFPW